MKSNIQEVVTPQLSNHQLTALRSLMESEGFRNLLKKLNEPFILEVEGLPLCVVEVSGSSPFVGGANILPGGANTSRFPAAENTAGPASEARLKFLHDRFLELLHLPEFAELLWRCTKPIVVEMGGLEFTVSRRDEATTPTQPPIVR